jgi:hypothetical protein
MSKAPPEIDPPAEPSLYSFAYTVKADDTSASFVVSGAGELPEGSLDPHDVIRMGETSREAIAAKARFVLGLMDGRLRGLGAAWNNVTVTNIYSVHDVNAVLAAEILPRIGAAGQHGVTWHYTRPPIVSIEFEMDLRGCHRHVGLGAAVLFRRHMTVIFRHRAGHRRSMEGSRSQDPAPTRG